MILMSWSFANVPLSFRTSLSASEFRLVFRKAFIQVSHPMHSGKTFSKHCNEPEDIKFFLLAQRWRVGRFLHENMFYTQNMLLAGEWTMVGAGMEWMGKATAWQSAIDILSRPCLQNRPYLRSGVDMCFATYHSEQVQTCPKSFEDLS